MITHDDRETIIRDPSAHPAWLPWLEDHPGAHLRITGDGALSVRIHQHALPTFIRRTDFGFQVVDGDQLWPAEFDDLAVAGAAARLRQRFRTYHHGRWFRGEPCWLSPHNGHEYPAINVPNALVAAMGRRPRPSGRQSRVRAHRVSFFVFTGTNPQLGSVGHACTIRPCVNPAHLDDVAPQGEPHA